MKSQTLALVFSIVMVFSSFVGCIDTEEESVTDDTNTDIVSLGNVMVSTYHVAELVRAEEEIELMLKLSVLLMFQFTIMSHLQQI